MPAGALARALVVLAVLQGVQASLVAEPQAISVARDYGASSSSFDVAVTSDAAAPRNLSATVRFASSASRRLSASRAAPAGRARRRGPEGQRHGGQRLLLGWKPPAGGGAAHARRLRAVEATLAAEGAELKVLDSVGVAVLSGGWRAARRLRTALPGVVDFIERDRVVRTAQSTTFSDPLASEQWALRAIRQADALQALGPALASQSREAVVAVADSGVDTDHVDLASRLWRNPREVARNGVDDDGNGFVDDVAGWNFASGVPDVDDADGHGTHCAGIVAAAADNGRGVVGVAAGAKVRIMPLKFVQSGGGLMSDAIGALEYALQNGADISSHSFGGPDHSIAFERALERAARQGHVVVAAAGNEGRSVDGHPQYPCAYNTGNVLCVAATNERSSLASFSNYGAGSVHLAAPGVDILSTALHGRYVESSGTSMAVPHVAGALALLRAAFPHLGLLHLRELLLRTVRPLPGLAVSSGGALDLGAAAGAALAATWARVIRAPASLCCGQRGVVRLELGTMEGAPPLPEGRHQAVLQLSTRANGESAEVPLELTVRGTPELHLSSGRQLVDFGQVAVSMRARSEIVIVNRGNGTAVANASVTSGDAIFSLLQQGPFVIAPGASTTVKVSCSPQRHGLASGTAIFVYSWSRGSGASMTARLPVALEAQGVAQANFSVERWSGVALLRPASLAGGLDASPAEWHRRLAAWDAPLVAPLASPPAAQRRGCAAFTGAHGLRGRIALVERGSCYFWRKALNCQAAGAIGVLVFNDRAGEGPRAMGMPNGVEEDEVPTIPAFFVSQASGLAALQALLGGAEVLAEFRLQPLVAHVASASSKWVEVALPISNTGGLPLTYTAQANADLFEQTGDYDVYVGHGSDGSPLSQVWHTLADDREVQFFRGQDDASIFIEFPAPFPFFGSVVTSGWLSLNGYIVLDPDYVPSNSYVAGWIGPERTPKAIIAPYWDDLYCGTFCKVRVGIVQTAESGSTQWAAVIQFEEVSLLSSLSRDRETVTFQLVLHHDGTIDVLYRRWPASASRTHLVVGVEGFNGHGIALHDHQTTTRLPWSSAEPYSIRMLPWLLPVDEAATSGALAPGRNASLRFRARVAHGDKQGWLVVAARDSHGSYEVSRNVRVVIQTATRFALRLPDEPATCGTPKVLTVVAESAYGEVALSEERNVRLVIGDGTSILREVIVQISRGEGNVTLASNATGSWVLSLRDDFLTGLDCSEVQTLVWASAQVATASLEVPAVLVAGVPFLARVVFRDGFGNPAAAPAAMLPPSSNPLLLRWRGAANPSGSAEIPHGAAGHEVELQFVAGRVELWLDVPAGSAGLRWMRAINVTVMPRLGEYVVGQWGACSTICGAGHRQRQVTCRAVDAATDASVACRGLVRPVDRVPCAGSCLRGSCLRREGPGHECACAVGFSGTTCDTFVGCPSGTSVIWNSSSDSLPERCEGVECSMPFSSRFLHAGMTNGGRFPSTADFTCARGYSLAGPANATCRSDGTWDLGGERSPQCHGPDTRNASCPRGSRCVVAIRGKGLSQRNQLALVRGAQACQLTDGARQGAVVLDAGNVVNSGAEQEFALPTASAVSSAQLTPGRYAMCWARDVAAAADAQHALVGVLTLTGPLPASLVCMLGVPCRLELRGVGLSAATNRVWLGTGSECSAGAPLRFDGWSADGPRIRAVDDGSQSLDVSWGIAIAGAVGQRGSLCWSSEEGRQATSLGRFTMEGPVQDAAHDCALGGPCSLTVEGQGLSLDDEIVLTVASSCPASSPAAPAQINTTNGVDALLRQGRAARFDLGVFFNAPQVQQYDPSVSAHTLCWIAAGEQSATYVRVGRVQFEGPYVQANAVCTLGVACAVQLVGRGFASQNVVQLVPSGSGFGSRCLEARYAQGGGLRAEGGRPEDVGKGIFRFGVPTEAPVGTYSICWAHSALATSLPAGQLELRGPRPEDHSCQLGRSCRLVVRGVGLASSDRIKFRLDSDCGGPSSGELGDLTGLRSSSGAARSDSAPYDLGVLRAGRVGQRHVLCWRPDGASAGVVAGTMELTASISYLESAVAEGLDVQYSVRSSCRIAALFLDPRRQDVQTALVTALAALQGVSKSNVTLETAYLHRLLRDEPIEGRKLLGGVTISFVTAAGSREGAQLMAQRLLEAVPGTAALTSFLWRLDLLLPEARVSGAAFLEPRVDVLVSHPFQRGGEGEEAKPPFDWLPWWPSTPEEWAMAITSVVLLVVAVGLTPVATFYCIASWRKRRNARRSGAGRTGGGVMPGPTVGSSPRRRSGIGAGSPQVYGRRSVTPMQDATVAEQNTAMMRMLDMGFGYEPSLAVLRKHNFDVAMAALELTQQRAQP